MNKERLEQRGNEKHNLEKKKKNGEKRQVDRKQLYITTLEILVELVGTFVAKQGLATQGT